MFYYWKRTKTNKNSGGPILSPIGPNNYEKRKNSIWFTNADGYVISYNLYGF